MSVPFANPRQNAHYRSVTAQSLSRAFAQLFTLITDSALRLKIPFRISPPGIRPITPNQRLAGPALPIRHFGSDDAIKGGRSLREQLDFARYLEKRAADPHYTFRAHLCKISGAIEEWRSHAQAVVKKQKN